MKTADRKYCLDQKNLIFHHIVNRHSFVHLQSNTNTNIRTIFIQLKMTI